jgi:hypothetical protein
LEADVVGRQAGGHDPRADDRHDQQSGTERLGREATSQVEPELPRTRLDLDGELAVGRMEPVGGLVGGHVGAHAALTPATSADTRRRSSSMTPSNTSSRPSGTGSGIDQWSHSGPAASSSWARSQTVTTIGGTSATASNERGQARPRPRPWRCAALTAARPLPGGLAPHGGRQLRAGRVGGADEQSLTDRDGAAGRQVGEGLGAQVHVAPAAVAARPGPLHQAHPFEHVEVVGEQVGLQREPVAQLHRGPVGDGELVDDGQADGIAERSVPGGPIDELVRGVHVPIISLSIH